MNRRLRANYELQLGQAIQLFEQCPVEPVHILTNSRIQRHHHVADDELIQVDDALLQRRQRHRLVEPTMNASPDVVAIAYHEDAKCSLGAAIRTRPKRLLDKFFNLWRPRRGQIHRPTSQQLAMASNVNQTPQRACHPAAF